MKNGRRSARALAAILCAAIALMLAAGCAAQDGAGDTEPEETGDSREYEVAWASFVMEQTERIRNGEKLDPRVHNLFCGGARDLDEIAMGAEGRHYSSLNHRGKARIMAYCAGVEDLVAEHREKG